MKQSYKTLLLWLFLFSILFIIYQIYTSSSRRSTTTTFSDFLNQVDRGNVESVTINGQSYRYKLKNSGETYSTTGIKSDVNLNKTLVDKNVGQITYENEEDSSIWTNLLVMWLPIALLVGLLVLFMKQIQVGSGKALTFGKSKAKLISENNKKITFNDVAGIDEAIEEVTEIVEFLKNPKKFQKLGGRIPKGVLLMGSPGTGKTLLARAIAGEAGVPFFSISGSDFVELFVGVGASRVRDLFEQGKKNAPCIIFIDEIDAVGRYRGAGLGGGHDEREQTLNQLLVEMDGFEDNEGVIIIAATNRPDVLDPALLRAGRFDRRIVIPKPDVKGRFDILKIHTRKIPLSENVDLEIIARGTSGFVGSDLENVVNEAALLAARKDKEKVEREDFDEAKDKIIMGVARKSMIISDKEKHITAYHEAGHTLVARTLPGTDPVHKVTIIPRGRAMGATHQLPQEDRFHISKDFAENQIAVLMGGRTAEEVIFNGQKTTGAAMDIEQATELARKMVCEWGMSEVLGPLSFGKKEETIFLGKEIAQHQDYSEQTAMEIDKEVKSIVTRQYEKAKKIISENKDKLVLLGEALLQYETLDTAEIDSILKGIPLKKDIKTDSRLLSHDEKTKLDDKSSESGKDQLVMPTPVKYPSGS